MGVIKSLSLGEIGLEVEGVTQGQLLMLSSRFVLEEQSYFRSNHHSNPLR